MCASVDSFERRPSAHPAPDSPASTVSGGAATGGVALAANAPARLRHFTLYRGHKEHPLQFDGERLAEAQTYGVAVGYHAAIYRTRDGQFISALSLISMPQLTSGAPERESEAAVFASLAAACAWFRSRRLTGRLLSQIASRCPDIIE